MKRKPAASIIQHLAAQLQMTLPGSPAQQQMAPPDRATAPAGGIAPKFAAVLVLLYPGADGQWHCLLIQRSADGGAHSQQIGFPGGKAEPGDADLAETALREAREEVGLYPSAVQPIGWLSSLYIPPSHFQVYPLLAVMDTAPDLKPDGREVQAVLPVPVARLQDPAYAGYKRFTLAGGRMITCPCFFVEEHGVWGATAMILNECLHVIRKTSLTL